LTKSVKWNLSVYVEDGPTLTSSEELDTQAVDVVSIKVDKGKTSTVDVQPGDLGEVQFIYIKSDLYDDPDDKGKRVQYKFIDGEKKSVVVRLDKDHILTSGNLVKMFQTSPKMIEFTNEKGIDANLQVVVARKAV
jgi:hypothetical protein